MHQQTTPFIAQISGTLIGIIKHFEIKFVELSLTPFYSALVFSENVK